MKSYARRSLFPKQIAWRKSEETDAAPSDTHTPGQWDRCDLESAGSGGNLLPLTPTCLGSCGLWHREHSELFLQTFNLCLYGPGQRLCWCFPGVSPFSQPPELNLPMVMV